MKRSTLISPINYRETCGNNVLRNGDALRNTRESVLIIVPKMNADNAISATRTLMKLNSNIIQSDGLPV